MWIAFLKKYVYSLLGFDNLSQIITMAKREQELAEYDPAQNVYNKLELDPEKKLRKISKEKQMTLLYWSFRGLTISIITRGLIYIIRFFLLNWLKLVHGNPLLVQIV